ncbi:TLC domain-containing protein [Baffinella frigidus]|nr:TLC domain-containing protein [Cryptophyta sp. CCMP2293]
MGVLGKRGAKIPLPPPKLEDALISGVPLEWAGPLLVMAVAFVGFLLVWMLSAKRPTSERLVRKYNLKVAQGDPNNKFDPVSGHTVRFFKAELATRIVSTLHALIACAGAARCLHMSPALYEDMLWTTSNSARFYFSISMAYFLGDILVCLVMFREYGPLFMLHAVCGLVSLCIICLGNQFHFFGLVGMLWELSTIFLNNRWFLLEYGKKGTSLFVVNGFVLVLVFTVIRVVVGCPYSYMFWSQLSVARADGKVSHLLYLGVTSMLAGFNCLNIYWCWQLVLGAFKVMGIKARTGTSPSPRKIR